LLIKLKHVTMPPLQSCLGMELLIQLVTSSTRRFLRCPRFWWSSGLKLLLHNPNQLTLGSSPIEPRIGPFILFSNRFRTPSCFSWEKHLGILPVSPLRAKSSSPKLVRLHKSVGSDLKGY